MDDWSDEFYDPVREAAAYSIALVKIAERAGKRTHPGTDWELHCPEAWATTTKRLLERLDGIQEGLIITRSLFVLRHLDMQNRPNVVYLNLSKGVWRESRDIREVGDIEILEREIRQSEEYLSRHGRPLSSLALADTGVTEEIPTAFRDSLPSSTR